MSELLGELKRAIEMSDETPAAISRGANVARSQLSRFLSGERGLSVEAVERVAEYLGLEIVVRRRRKGR